MSNPLSDIYANQVLLNEAKSNVVTKKGEIDPHHKAKPTKGGPKGVKGVPAPVTKKEYTGKGKIKESMQNTTNRSAFGGTFEKLFKATLTESDVAEDAASDFGADETVPSVTPEEAHDEIHDTEDEVTDLADDLRTVIAHLESILDKVGGVGEELPGEEAGEEGLGEEGEQEFEESIGEAVSDPELKPLADKSGVYQGPKKANTVKSSSVKPHGGKAHGGKVTEDPELKAAPDKSGVYQGPKKANTVKSSNIKVGDFFK
jgi:hypothetical protein